MPQRIFMISSDGLSMRLEQATVRLGLCMFDFGGLFTSRFTPHLCLIPSMHDS